MSKKDEEIVEVRSKRSDRKKLDLLKLYKKTDETNKEIVNKYLDTLVYKPIRGVYSRFLVGLSAIDEIISKILYS